jgi:hypothetical protein
MPHTLDGRPRAAGQRLRALALILGTLALVAGLLGPAVAAAKAPHGAKRTAAARGDHPPSGDRGAGKKDETKGDEAKKRDVDADADADAAGEADEQGCDSSGHGNPCHPPQACGQNSGPGSGNPLCAPGAECDSSGSGSGSGDANEMCAPQCQAGNEGPGHADDNDDTAKAGRHGHRGAACVADNPHNPDNPDNPEACPPGRHREGDACVADNPDNPPCQVNCNPAPGCTVNCTPVTTATPAITTSTPATTTSTGTAPGTTTGDQPTSAVAGTQAASAGAGLIAPRRCQTRAFRVTVRGRSIRRVTFLVGGRRVRTVTVPAGRRSITVSLPVRRFGARRQSVQARVTFRNGAAVRILTAPATRCAQATVSPQFTG